MKRSPVKYFCCFMSELRHLRASKLQGDSLPHHSLHHMLQGNLCSGAWSTSSPSFFTDLGVCGVVPLTSSHSTL